MSNLDVVDPDCPYVTSDFLTSRYSHSNTNSVKEYLLERIVFEMLIVMATVDTSDGLSISSYWAWKV